MDQTSNGSFKKNESPIQAFYHSCLGKLAILIGILIGIAIPIIIMVLRNMFDTTIHDRIDVQKTSNVPFLGDVPYEKEVSGHAIRVRENGRDSLSESFRLIRSSLEYMK